MVQANRDGLSFNRPEITLNVLCKIKTTEVFRSINEL
jgi:hypothetical protein